MKSTQELIKNSIFYTDEEKNMLIIFVQEHPNEEENIRNIFLEDEKNTTEIKEDLENDISKIGEDFVSTLRDLQNKQNNAYIWNILQKMHKAQQEEMQDKQQEQKDIENIDVIINNL